VGVLLWPLGCLLVTPTCPLRVATGGQLSGPHSHCTSSCVVHTNNQTASEFPEQLPLCSAEVSAEGKPGAHL
jgi:hypothetical protein